MWKLYDELYIGIPSGIRITDCVVGDNWTAVKIDGNIGFARTIEKPQNAAEFAAGFVGKFLRDTACHLHWDTLAKSAVGVAAMNAWYNTPERAAGLDSAERRLSSHAKKIAIIGKKDNFPMPMSPDFDTAPYEKLKDYDKIVIKSTALITRALPKLLEIIGEGGHVILDGSSLPLSALFFSFGMPVREIKGFYTERIETVEAWALNNIETVAEGVLPFTVCPVKIEKIHESTELKKALSSPYGASKFNNNFNAGYYPDAKS